MSTETQRGPRPDLAKLECNQPYGFIGNTILPVTKSFTKTGSLYYTTLAEDVATETDRVSGAAPTATLVAPSNVSYTCTEKIARTGVSRDEVLQWGGIEKADAIASKLAKRSVLKAVESLQAQAIITSSAYSAASDVHTAIFDGIGQAADSVRLYGGKMALILSSYGYRWLVKQTEVTGKLGYSFANGKMEDILSINENVVKAMLQSLFLFDYVLIGDDASWKITHREDACVVARVADPEEGSEKIDPVLGKTVVYTSGDGDFTMESFYSDTTKTNYYDATEYAVVKVLNAGAAKVLKGFGTATT